jgi:hypothetical protein
LSQYVGGGTSWFFVVIICLATHFVGYKVCSSPRVPLIYSSS